MNTPEDESPLYKAFSDGSIYTMLEQYVGFCLISPDAIDEADDRSSKTKKKESLYKRFPNIAGFCRHLGVGMDELLTEASRFPREFGRIRAILEDEALNASLSPTVIAAYFKKRLGYDKENERTDNGLPEIRFEHDIWEDGE